MMTLDACICRNENHVVECLWENRRKSRKERLYSEYSDVKTSWILFALKAEKAGGKEKTGPGEEIMRI